MSRLERRFEILDWRETPMGAISLRRRLDPALEVEVYEVKLGDEFLMSSLFTAAETELARLGLAELAGDGLDVLVGGLGLGYTARTVLEDPRVRSLTVVEILPEVISWHERGLVPCAAVLTADPRCRLINGDFFAMTTGQSDPTSDPTQQRFHAILLDIDHAPDHVLQPSHAPFYTRQGLNRLGARLHSGGVFGLWSDDPPDERFLAVLRDAFSVATAHVVGFANPYTNGQSANTVYIARP
jgi:spermidine synthase